MKEVLIMSGVFILMFIVILHAVDIDEMMMDFNYTFCKALYESVTIMLR